MKKLKTIVLVFLIGLVLVGCSKKVDIKPTEIKKENIPTVFLHGYSGSNVTMKTMMDSFEQSDLAKTEMIMRVSEEGEVTIDDSFTGKFKENNPSIRLIFENSRSDQWHQAEWLRNALAYLKATHQVEKVNLVGFSMGGISSFLYLETFSHEESQPSVEKLIGIGSPFNEFLENQGQSKEDLLKNGPRDVSEQLTNYQQLITNIPETTKFLLIAGQLSEEDLSDGTVPLSSGIGVYQLLEQQGLSVEMKIIEGSKAKHSKLKRDTEVIQLVADFLWQ